MLRIDPADDELNGLIGRTLPSARERGKSYRIVRRIGGGGMASAMLAVREAEGGATPVVLKMLRPSFVRAAGGVAGLSVRKEAAALGSLNERVPTTPYVVRLLDVGVTPIRQGEHVLHIDWLVLEYVNGGSEGTTLKERVAYSIEKTGAAFDPLRAADAIRCIGQGLTAVHEVGVLHRDLKPSNVLCCGFGDREILKICDFGIARPAGGPATFGNAAIGTPGYAAPEQLFGDTTGVSPASDVFGFAAIVYFLLTGTDYLASGSLGEMMRAIQSPERPRLAAAPKLSGELRKNPAVCAALDAAIARATSLAPEDRPGRPGELAEQLLAPLFTLKALQSTTVSRLPSRADRASAIGRDFTWLERQRPWRAGVARSAAWDADGRCLVTTTHGALFWNGTDWWPALGAGTTPPCELNGVARSGAARWLLLGDAGRLFELSPDGLRELEPCPDRTARLECASGALGDMLVVAGRSGDGTPVLLTSTSVGWLTPRPVPELAVINSLARCSPTQWLLAARTPNAGVVLLFAPLEGALRLLDGTPARAYVACAADGERQTGIAVGPDGACVIFDQGRGYAERIDSSAHLSAAAVDLNGGYWAGAANQLYYRGPLQDSSWRRVWQTEGWAPLIGMTADSGAVLAVTSNGAVLEGECSSAVLG
jgi:eukaryotic-like serine/threonine-protein kinase